MLSGWTKYLQVKIPASKVTAVLTDFPVYVDVSTLPWAFSAGINQVDGRDIRVTLADGTTEVPRELVAMNPAGRTGAIYFKATLSNVTDNIFQIQYGNAAATEPAKTATYGSGNVWNTSYQAVYHFGDLAIPTLSTSFSDNFTAPNGTYLINYNSSVYVLDPFGTQYLIIQSNRINRGGSASCNHVIKHDPGVNDYYYEGQVSMGDVDTTASIQLFIRSNSATTYSTQAYGGIWDWLNRTVKLYRNGVQIGATYSYTAGTTGVIGFTYTYKVEALGNEIKVYIDGVVVCSYTDPSPLTGRYGGINFAGRLNSGGSFDNFVIGKYSSSTTTTTDSTKNNRNATAYGALIAGQSVTGKMDKALSLDGINDALTVPWGGVNGAVTVQGWVRTRTVTGARTFIDMGSDSDPVGSGGWGLSMYQNPTNWGGSIIAEPPTTQFGVTGSVVTMNTWKLLHTTWVSGSLKYFEDGAQVGSTVTTVGTIRKSATVSSMGGFYNKPTFSNFVDGLIDEVRYVSTNLSTNWIAAEYSNQNSPSTFYEATFPEYKLTDYSGNTNTLSAANAGDGSVVLYTNNFSSTGLGADWTVNAGVLSLSGGYLTNTDAGANALFYYNPSMGSANQSIEAVLNPTTGDGFLQFVLRASGIDTLRAAEGYYAYAQYNGGVSYTFQILENHGGTLNTVLASVTQNSTVPVTVKFTAVGSLLTLYVNGVSTLTATNADITQIGTVVVRLGYNGNQMDDLTVKKFVTRNSTQPSSLVPYSGLDFSTQLATSPSYLSALDSASLSITGPITLEGWFYINTLPSEVSHRVVLASKTSTTAAGLSYYWIIEPNNPSNPMWFYYWDASSNSSNWHATSWVPTKNVWTHLAVVCDTPTATATFYVNGSPIATTRDNPSATSINNSADELWFGAGDASTQLDAYIAELRLWNKARSAAQIAYYYNRRIANTTPGLAAYYPFSNGTVPANPVPTTTLNSPFSGALIPGNIVPPLIFTGVTLGEEDITYRLQLDVVNTFDGTGLVDVYSATNPGFSATADTDPFSTGNQVTYTIQTALLPSTTYYWRVMGKNTGTGAWGSWTAANSFITGVAGGDFRVFGDEGLVA
jgi:hypothetical protein